VLVLSMPRLLYCAAKWVEHEHVAGGACGSNRAPAKRLKMARSFSVLLHFSLNGIYNSWCLPRWEKQCWIKGGSEAAIKGVPQSGIRNAFIFVLDLGWSTVTIMAHLHHDALLWIDLFTPLLLHRKESCCCHHFLSFKWVNWWMT
jgi:hypothetical protein